VVLGVGDEVVWLEGGLEEFSGLFEGVEEVLEGLDDILE